MFGIFLVIFFALLLIIIVYSVQEPEDQNPILAVLLSGYFLRLVIRMFNRDLVVFSSGQTLGGADAVIYERRASMITQFWNYTGVHFVT
ncbi:MAG: hypothetical protein JKY15_04455, partial [Deltaproteobacteria bacterium]|nr:hypothetical protein [Deltaproteobacteria bacterium]